MSGYRDSYFQYHHLPESYQVLYNEWNQDEFPPPDEQAVNHNYNHTTYDERKGSNLPEETGDAAAKAGKVNGATNNVYWDYFHDEEDWNLFKNVQLESNGIATFTLPGNRRIRSPDDDDRSGETTTSITGSIFNHRITQQAIKHNNNWNDLCLPRP